MLIGSEMIISAVMFCFQALPPGAGFTHYCILPFGTKASILKTDGLGTERLVDLSIEA